MTWTEFWNTLRDALSLKNSLEYYIQVGAATLVSAVLIWAWKTMINGWAASGRQKVAFWFISIPGIFLLLLILTGLFHTAPITIQVSDPATHESAPSGPDFTGYIESIEYAPPGTSNAGNDTLVASILRISNRGAPSIVWKWDMEITLLSGQRIEPKIHFSPVPMMLSAASASLPVLSGTTTLKMDAGSNLPYSLGQTPLETGGAREGWVVFDFGNVSMDEIRRPGTLYTLKAFDTNGKAFPIILQLPAENPD